MANQIVENDLMKLCSQCGILKKKTTLFFKNNYQKFRKKCMQYTKIKQKESTSIFQKQVRKLKNNRKHFFHKTMINFLNLEKSITRRKKSC